MMTERKICLKLLLCSLTVFFSLAVSVLFFGTSSKAATRSEIENLFSRNGIIISSSAIDDLMDNVYFSNNDVGFLVLSNQIKIGSLESGYDYSYGVLDGRYGFLKNGNSNAYQCYSNVYNYNSSNKTVGSYVEGSLSTYGLWSWSQTSFYDWTGESHVNWDDPYYSANIVAPEMSVTYRDLSSTPIVDVPLNIGIESYPNSENEYYVQIFGLINYDENYYVKNSRDGLIYNGMDLQRYTTYVDIVTPQELLKSSDLSYDMIHLRFTDGWYNHFPPDSLFSFTFQDGIPVPLQTSAINKFNSFRKNATFADNTVYVYARYFVIDENDNFVVGSWRVWKSYNPNEFTTEIPAYYLPYSVVPGTVGTNENVDPVSSSSPEPSVIINPVNTSPNVNVTVTQNVPNYPDYPTIASYNKDNLLVDTINSLNSFTQFFGDFGLFLTAAFGFIPEWIWGIIGVGFSLSIIVMFLKIL